MGIIKDSRCKSKTPRCITVTSILGQNVLNCHENKVTIPKTMRPGDVSERFVPSFLSLSLSANHAGRLCWAEWAAGARTHLSFSTRVRLWNHQRHIITVISVRWAKTCQSKTHESWHIKRFGSLKHNLPSKPWLAALQVNVWSGMRERISLEWCDRSTEIWEPDSRVRCCIESNSIPNVNRTDLANKMQNCNLHVNLK